MEANALRTGRVAVVLTGVIAAFLAAAAQSQQPYAIRQSVAGLLGIAWAAIALKSGKL